MWRTLDGTLHTVALPHPGQVFTERALESVESVVATLSEGDVQDVVEGVEDAVFDLWSRQVVDEQVERAFHAQPAPREIFKTLVSDRVSLATALGQVDPRWCLDVVLAVQDLSDELDGE